MNAAANKIQGSSPSPGKPPISVSFVLNAMRRWWKVAVPVGLVLGAAAASFLYWRFELQFQARARLQLNQDYIVFPREQQPSIEFIRTQGELIRSTLVLQPVIADAEIMRVPEIAEADDPIVHLKQNLVVQPVGGAQLFDVLYTAADRNDAALVVNRVVDSYFELRESQDQKRTREVTGVLEKAKDYWEAEVKKAELKVRELAIGAADSADAGTPIGAAQRDPTSDIRVQLVLLEAEAEELKVLKNKLEEPLTEDAVSELLVEQAVDENPQVVELRARLFRLQADLREIESKGRTPSYAGYKQQVANTQRQLDQLREDVREQIRQSFTSQLYFQRADELAQLEKNREGLQARIDHLRKQVASQTAATKTESRKAQSDAIALEFARNEQEHAKDVRDLIVGRMIRIDTEQPMSPVLPMIPAAAPGVPVEQLPYRNMGLAALAGLALPFGLAVLWELRVRRVSDCQQFQEQANIEVIGEIANLPVRTFQSRFRTRSFERSVRLFEESVDSLSTYLVLAEPLRDLHVLAVSSAESREGKTSVGSKLALSVAQATNAPTLLIDGDMRSPDMHNLFGVPMGPGLVGVLSGQASLDEAVVKTDGASLDLLPAGILRDNPLRLLGNGAFKSLMTEVRTRYRYVILDTPPILPASEALLLASAADAAVMCVMRDRSSLDRVARANARLQSAGVRVLGAVLNGVPSNHYAKRYGDYKYER